MAESTCPLSKQDTARKTVDEEERSEYYAGNIMPSNEFITNFLLSKKGHL